MLTSSRATNILLILVLAVGLAIVAILASDARGGPLDPAGAPSSTMRTLSEVLPAWDQKLTAVSTDPCNSPRFQCVLPDAGQPTGAAVLDRETGLVWERTPSSSTSTWSFGLSACRRNTSGGRWGWRMPTVDELSSLLDSDNAGPFTLGGPLIFWTTTQADLVGNRILVSFNDIGSISDDSVFTSHQRWCVRGGTSHDPQ